ncbi:MAG: metallophosphoesterase [Clostridia bacterium]|nr:metallophosphoesterase [Clostridia bacterium]
MIYVTSDLHGYPLEDFLALLDGAGFSDRDFLFVLGDVIDRGDEGAELLRWIAEQPNVQLILGNHEAMLLACDFVFDDITDDNLSRLSSDKLSTLSTWLYNGAQPTLSGLRRIRDRDPDVLEGILDCLRDAPLYETAEAGGKKFVLVHAGFENFDKNRNLDDYAADELIWTRPDRDTRYFDGATVILGHTPTHYYGEEHRGKILHADGWIDIDTGAAGGGAPALLRLDDMQEFYR